MERLTKKESFGALGEHYSAYHNGKCIWGGIVDKLAQYEDFMEENGFESLEDIKQLIKNMEYYEGRYKWQCKNSRINYEEFLNLQQENEQLKQQIADKEELLKNAIVPKFKVGEKVWYISHYNEVISNTIYNIHYYSNKEISYNIPNLQREEFRINESEIFSTEQEAEEALKKMEGSV